MKWAVILVLIAIVISLAYFFHTEEPSNLSHFGKFKGKLVLESIFQTNHDFVLKEAFGYVDPNGTEWSVPPGAIVNGASIPEFLWSFIGGPLSGKYKEASVIHDYYCAVRSRTTERTHEAFYYASKANGVPEKTAWIMFIALLNFSKTRGCWWPYPRKMPVHCDKFESVTTLQCVNLLTYLDACCGIPADGGGGGNGGNGGRIAPESGFGPTLDEQRAFIAIIRQRYPDAAEKLDIVQSAGN